MNSQNLVGTLLSDIGLGNENSSAVLGSNPDSASYAVRSQSSESWLRTRLFEPLVAYYGLFSYLDNLSKYQGVHGEKDVKINSLLATFHLSTSLNPMIYESLLDLKKTNRIQLNEKQLAVLSEILRPSKFRLGQDDIKVDFEPLQLEDIRLEIQKHIYDKIELSRQKESKRKLSESMASSPDTILPDDLQELGHVGNVDINRVQSLSRQYDALTITIRGGCIIWQFARSPTIYIKDGKAFVSKKSGSSLRDATKQKDSIIRLLYPSRSRTKCVLCNNYDGAEVALLDGAILGLICSQCEKDPRVTRLIPSVAPGEL
jgi:hypothetical protein